jgi:MSHA biogenesis protein MshQ
MDPTTGGDRDMDLESLQSPSACPSATSPLHHLEIVGSDNGVTCDANDFIIRAWADAEQNTRFTAAAITGEMTHSGDSDVTVTYPKSPIFTIDSGLSETTIQVNVTKEGTVTFDATATGATGNTTCRLGGANSCDFLASSVGFIFSNLDKATDILTQTAGKDLSIYLRAVKTDSDTAACVAALDGNSAIELGYTCNNPTTCNNNYLDITTADGTKTTVKSTDSSDEPSFVELSFDDEGYAPLTFNYRDVGNITLNASKVPSEDLLTEMRGDSNAFVVKPDHFQITLDQLSAEDPPLSATGPDSEIFTSAGTDFGVTVTAMNADDEMTPNYGNENDPETIALTHTLVKPTIEAGGVPGDLNTSLPTVGNGSFSVNANWSEVGIINLIATVDGIDGANYLGASADDATTTLSNVGRFTPATLLIEAVNQGSFISPTSAPPFIYVGQPFSYDPANRPSFKVTALNAFLNVTENYSGAWGKLKSIVFTGPTEDTDKKGADGSAPMELNYVPDNTGFQILTSGAALPLAFKGVFNVTFIDDIFTYTKDSNSQVPPFKPSVDLIINSVTDDDDIIAAGVRDIDGDTSESITLNPTGADSQIRFGRLQMENNHGSELTALVMPMQIEIFNDSKTWEIHTADTTTQMADDDLTFIDELSSAYDSKPEVVNTPALSGILNVNLSSPGPDINGYIDVTPDLSTTGANLEWLRFDWSGTSSTFDEDPTAKATFGIYKGSSFQIYIQQAFPK